MPIAENSVPEDLKHRYLHDPKFHKIVTCIIYDRRWGATLCEIHKNLRNYDCPWEDIHLAVKVADEIERLEER